MEEQLGKSIGQVPRSVVVTKPRMNWQFIEDSRNVHRLKIKLDKPTEEAWVLVMSDVHWDSPHCDRDMLARHLKEAKDRNAPVLDVGDFFDAMQGKYDPRSCKDDLRPELARGNYIDECVKQAADWLEPYSSQLCLRGYGNHETSIKKRHETDMIERLTERLKAQGSPAKVGGYSGFVRISVQWGKTENKDTSGTIYWYHHGYGGGGPVTRGTIQTSRQAVYVANAGIVHNGHTHDAWVMPIQRIELTHKNTIKHTRQLHVRTPGYKEEYQDGFGGWHIERGGPPKPTGAAWIRFRFVFDKDGRSLETDVIEAR